MKNIALEIERLRKSKNLKQSDLAKQTNVSLATYYNLIKLNDFKVSYLLKVSKILNVPISYFFDTMSIDSKKMENLKIQVKTLKKQLETHEKSNVMHEKYEKSLEKNIATIAKDFDMLKNHISQIKPIINKYECDDLKVKLAPILSAIDSVKLP